MELKDFVDRAVRAVAETAYEIRSSYRNNGWAVRYGLVQIQSYKKLIELASKKAEPDIVKRIVETDVETTEEHCTAETKHDKYSWRLFKQEMRQMFLMKELAKDVEGADRYDHRVKFSPQYPEISRETFVEMGRLRAGEFLNGGRPYAREARCIRNMLTCRLNKQQFRREVDRWMKRYAKEYETIDWKALDNARIGEAKAKDASKKV